MIAVEALRFAYREAVLFTGIDLHVKTGEMVALIGPNGSGKTTLLKLMSGALRPGSGRVLLGGRPFAELTSKERARLVGVVPQESSAVFDFTVMETVLMGRTAHLGLFGIEGPDDIAMSREAMTRTGTLPFAARLMSHLSGGERQLALIARALAQKPRLLLLDEPTAFLDIRHRLEIYELLVRLNAEEGLTIIATSHDLNMAARYCRRIVLLKHGEVRADGDAARVFDPAILSDVYETPLRVTTDPETGKPYTIPRGSLSRPP